MSDSLRTCPCGHQWDLNKPESREHDHEGNTEAMRERLTSIIADNLVEQRRREFACLVAFVALVIETLTCETCEGFGTNPEVPPPPDGDDSCPVCNGSKLDPVKVQAVLRQFVDAGVLTEETEDRNYFYEGWRNRFVGPWAPSHSS